MIQLNSASRVAVTGGAGFIGLHLIRALVERGCACYALVPAEVSTDLLRSTIPEARVVLFSEPDALGPATADLNPAVVFHLGAKTSGRRTIENVKDTFQWNLLSTLSLFQALVGTEVRRVVHLGSCEEYGRRETPFNEEMPADPVSPYSASKAATSCYARMFFNCFSLPVTVIRPSVVYGPRQGSNMMIPEVIAALLRRRQVDATEGRQKRDFLFIGDLIEALLKAATIPSIEGEIFNVGYGESITVRESIELIEELIGTKGLVRFGAKPLNSSEILEYSVDVRHAWHGLQWRSTTTLREGLKETIHAFADESKGQ